MLTICQTHNIERANYQKLGTPFFVVRKHQITTQGNRRPGRGEDGSCTGEEGGPG